MTGTPFNDGWAYRRPLEPLAVGVVQAGDDPDGAFCVQHDGQGDAVVAG